MIDSDKVPQNAKRRIPYLSGAGGFYLNDSVTNSHGAATSTASSASSVVPSPTTTKDANSHTTALQNITRQLTNQSAVSQFSAMEEEDIVIDGTHEIVDLITRCLRICGEEDGFLPLFKVVFNTLSDVEDNRYTRRLDGRARDILLTGLITRMVRYVSEHVNLVFISDDVQCKYTAICMHLIHGLLTHDFYRG